MKKLPDSCKKENYYKIITYIYQNYISLSEDF